MSLTKGWVRVVLTSQLDPSLMMRGVITTLHKMGAMHTPSSAPIVYVKRNEFEGMQFGEITPADGPYADYRRLLKETVDESYARLARL